MFVYITPYIAISTCYSYHANNGGLNFKHRFLYYIPEFHQIPLVSEYLLPYSIKNIYIICKIKRI